MGGIITCSSDQVKAILTYIVRSITGFVSLANYVSYYYHYNTHYYFPAVVIVTRSPYESSKVFL
jgi:hypothetical protein